MLTLTGSVRVFVCTQPTDMRRSFDGLCGMVQGVVEQDPLSGHLFVFRNRNRDRLKILYWDRDGMAIWCKRLESGTWQFPTDLRRRAEADSVAGGAEISREELSLLLGGIDLRSVERRRRYQRPHKPR
ncbi:MAG: IS66 family insertion sequence element accessory protein TnpB [Caldilineaceae bacterium]|nr:IS66 family insertion sequence element accessory protein TnpB [Caldilineaceae bacterium]